MNTITSTSLFVFRGCDHGTRVESYYQRILVCAFKGYYYAVHCSEQDPISGFQLPAALHYLGTHLGWSTLKKTYFCKPQPPSWFQPPWFQVDDDIVMRSVLGQCS